MSQPTVHISLTLRFSLSGRGALRAQNLTVSRMRSQPTSSTASPLPVETEVRPGIHFSPLDFPASFKKQMALIGVISEPIKQHGRRTVNRTGENSGLDQDSQAMTAGNEAVFHPFPLFLI